MNVASMKLQCLVFVSLWSLTTWLFEGGEVYTDLGCHGTRLTSDTNSSALRHCVNSVIVFAVIVDHALSNNLVGT